jgi:hypothetical protein
VTSLTRSEELGLHAIQDHEAPHANAPHHHLERYGEMVQSSLGTLNPRVIDPDGLTLVADHGATRMENILHPVSSIAVSQRDYNATVINLGGNRNSVSAAATPPDVAH